MTPQEQTDAQMADLAKTLLGRRVSAMTDEEVHKALKQTSWYKRRLDGASAHKIKSLGNRDE